VEIKSQSPKAGGFLLGPLGDLNDAQSLALLGFYKNLRSQGLRFLALDLSQTGQVNGAGLGALKHLEIEMARLQGRLILIGAGARVKRLLEITGISPDWAENPQMAQNLMETP